MICENIRRVPFFHYPSVFLDQEEELVAIFRDVGARGAFILQQELVRFEQNVAAFVGARYAFGVGNATDGLHIALRAAGMGAGAEIIFSSHTMVATAAAIHFTGAVGVPVECGPDHLIDPAAVEAAVTPRTMAIVPTHLNGRCCDMAALEAIAIRHGLAIVEDAAQALGARFGGRCAATFGSASAVSFYPAKLLGCLGDGGAVFTHDDRIAERLGQLRDHGRDASGEVVGWGFNTRLDNLQAAILDFRLRRYQETIEWRRRLAGLYQERLADVAEVVLPPAPDSDPNRFDVYQNYEIEADRRDDLQQYLRQEGIGTLVAWGGRAVHQWKALGFRNSLPYTERLFERLLMLPMNSSLSEDDVDAVCDRVARFYGR